MNIATGTDRPIQQVQSSQISEYKNRLITASRDILYVNHRNNCVSTVHTHKKGRTVSHVELPEGASRRAKVYQSQDRMIQHHFFFKTGTEPTKLQYEHRICSDLK